MKILKYESFLETMQFAEVEGEAILSFPEPIELGGKIYKTTNDLQKDYYVNITNFDDEIEINGTPYKDWAESFGSGSGEGEVEEPEMEGEVDIEN